MLDKEMIRWLHDVEQALAVPHHAAGVLLECGVVIEIDVHLFYRMPAPEFAAYLAKIWTVNDKKAVRTYIQEAK